MEYCPKCGVKTHSEARFCHACGTSLEEAPIVDPLQVAVAPADADLVEAGFNDPYVGMPTAKETPLPSSDEDDEDDDDDGDSFVAEEPSPPAEPTLKSEPESPESVATVATNPIQDAPVAPPPNAPPPVAPPPSAPPPVASPPAAPPQVAPPPMVGAAGSVAKAAFVRAHHAFVRAHQGINQVPFETLTEAMELTSALALDPGATARSKIDPEVAQNLNMKLKVQFDSLVDKYGMPGVTGQAVHFVKSSGLSFLKGAKPMTKFDQNPELWIANVNLFPKEAALFNQCLDEADKKQGLEERVLRTCSSCRFQRIINPDYESLLQRKRFADMAINWKRSILRVVSRANADPSFVCMRCQGLEYNDRTIVQRSDDRAVSSMRDTPESVAVGALHAVRLGFRATQAGQATGTAGKVRADTRAWGERPNGQAAKDGSGHVLELWFRARARTVGPRSAYRWIRSPKRG